MNDDDYTHFLDEQARQALEEYQRDLSLRYWVAATFLALVVVAVAVLFF